MIVVLDIGSSSLRSSLWERDGSSLGEQAQIEQAGTDGLEADPSCWSASPTCSTALPPTAARSPRSATSTLLALACSASTTAGGR